jgi:hypothetical protein
MTIAELFNKYGSDKVKNEYTEMYELILDPQRDDPLRILEIGIGTVIPGVQSSMARFHGPGYRPGGSLRAFRDYCPRAEVLGLDIQPDTQFSEERIETGICDTIDGLAVARFFAYREELFDVVIDDGFHAAHAQIATLVNFHAKVRWGGYYVIEDIFTGSPVFTDWKNIVGNHFELVHQRINAIVLRKRESDSGISI